MHMRTALMPLVAAGLLGLAGTALGQDHGGNGHGMASELPAICTSAAMPPMAAPTPMPEGMGEAHQALMATMDPMHMGMAQGMMAEDIDVAFVCGMIPHHQGAIDMARVQLEHGTDPWAREMAQKVIEAQEAEIADMIKWLAERSE